MVDDIFAKRQREGYELELPRPRWPTTAIKNGEQSLNVTREGTVDESI